MLLIAAESIDFEELRDHWLNVHAPNVASVLERVGGMRYAISISDEPTVDPYVGMAEIYFPDKDVLRNYLDIYDSDGIERYFNADTPLIFRSNTEMIGIP